MARHGYRDGFDTLREELFEVVLGFREGAVVEFTGTDLLQQGDALGNFLAIFRIAFLVARLRFDRNETFAEAKQEIYFGANLHGRPVAALVVRDRPNLQIALRAPPELVFPIVKESSQVATGVYDVRDECASKRHAEQEQNAARLCRAPKVTRNPISRDRSQFDLRPHPRLFLLSAPRSVDYLVKRSFVQKPLLADDQVLVRGEKFAWTHVTFDAQGTAFETAVIEKNCPLVTVWLARHLAQYPILASRVSEHNGRTKF